MQYLVHKDSDFLRGTFLFIAMVLFFSAGEQKREKKREWWLSLTHHCYRSQKWWCLKNIPKNGTIITKPCHILDEIIQIIQVLRCWELQATFFPCFQGNAMRDLPAYFRCLNSNYFHIIGKGHKPNSRGIYIYIPIIRIPTKGGMSLSPL